MTDHGLSREELVEGDAFVRAYETYSRPILVFFIRRVFEAESAMGLTAETFAQAFVARRRFRGKSKPELEAWLFAIARAQLSHYMRRGQAERRAMRRLGIERPALVDEDIERLERLAGTEQLRTLVAESLAELDERQREALRLRVVDDVAYSDIAARLGISEQTARARVSRALRALADAVDQRRIRDDGARP